MIHTLREFVVSNLMNLPGWRTGRKLVVIESDDWGSIRMPSKDVYHFLKTKGYRVSADPFMMFDSLAGEPDLSALFDILNSVSDSKGQPAVITANTIVANPDFKRIRESDFRQYHYEDFRTTLNRYPEHSGSFSLWKQGMESGIFHPQFHGREHLNTGRWMKALQQNDPLIRQAFDLEMISISSEPSPMVFGYMESLDYHTDEEKDSKEAILTDGMQLFEQIFGYCSTSFIANCFVWTKQQEEVLQKSGVKYLQGIVQQLSPEIVSGKHRFTKKYHYTGQTNNAGLTYLTRNAYFEPCLYPGSDPVDACLKRVSTAFRYGKPAIISAHRLNFIGFIDPVNRDTNLKRFELLLRTMVKKWPEIEFITSDQLGNIINQPEDSNY